MTFLDREHAHHEARESRFMLWFAWAFVAFYGACLAGCQFELKYHSGPAAVAGGHTTSQVRGCDAPAAATLESFAPTADYQPRPWGLLSFDGRTKTPRWTLERLDESSLTVAVSRDNHAFHADEGIPKTFRVVPGDYDNAGQDRGHLACAANHRSNQAEFDSTFCMSNMMPQHPNVNEQVWAHLENAIRSMAGAEVVVWVVTAPAWLPSDSGRIAVKTIGARAVWQPTHCVKAVLIQRGKVFECMAWIVPNIADPSHQFETYRVTTDDAEAAIGVDLWSALPDDIENRIENVK